MAGILDLLLQDAMRRKGLLEQVLLKKSLLQEQIGAKTQQKLLAQQAGIQKEQIKSAGDIKKEYVKGLMQTMPEAGFWATQGPEYMARRQQIEGLAGEAQQLGEVKQGLLLEPEKSQWLTPGMEGGQPQESPPIGQEQPILTEGQAQKAAGANIRLAEKYGAPKELGDPRSPDFAKKVAAIQKKLGIKADGIWGPQTKQAFEKAGEKEKVVTIEEVPQIARRAEVYTGKAAEIAHEQYQLKIQENELKQKVAEFNRQTLYIEDANNIRKKLQKGVVEDDDILSIGQDVEKEIGEAEKEVERARKEAEKAIKASNNNANDPRLRQEAEEKYAAYKQAQERLDFVKSKAAQSLHLRETLKKVNDLKKRTAWQIDAVLSKPLINVKGAGEESKLKERIFNPENWQNVASGLREMAAKYKAPDKYRRSGEKIDSADIDRIRDAASMALDGLELISKEIKDKKKMARVGVLAKKLVSILAFAQKMTGLTEKQEKRAKQIITVIIKEGGDEVDLAEGDKNVFIKPKKQTTKLTKYRRKSLTNVNLKPGEMLDKAAKLFEELADLREAFPEQAPPKRADYDKLQAERTKKLEELKKARERLGDIPKYKRPEEVVEYEKRVSEVEEKIDKLDKEIDDLITDPDSSVKQIDRLRDRKKVLEAQLAILKKKAPKEPPLFEKGESPERAIKNNMREIDRLMDKAETEIESVDMHRSFLRESLRHLRETHNILELKRRSYEEQARREVERANILFYPLERQRQLLEGAPGKEELKQESKDKRALAAIFARAGSIELASAIIQNGIGVINDPKYRDEVEKAIANAEALSSKQLVMLQAAIQQMGIRSISADLAKIKLQKEKINSAKKAILANPQTPEEKRVVREYRSLKEDAADGDSEAKAKLSEVGAKLEQLAKKRIERGVKVEAPKKKEKMPNLSGQ